MKDIARMALPPHRRIDLKAQIQERADQLGISLADFDCPLVASSENQPTITEMVATAVKLRCIITFTDITLKPVETENHE